MSLLIIIIILLYYYFGIPCQIIYIKSTMGASAYISLVPTYVCIFIKKKKNFIGIYFGVPRWKYESLEKKRGSINISTLVFFRSITISLLLLWNKITNFYLRFVLFTLPTLTYFHMPIPTISSTYNFGLHS